MILHPGYAASPYETNAEYEERLAVQAGRLEYPVEPELDDEQDVPCCPDRWVSARRMCGCW